MGQEISVSYQAVKSKVYRLIDSLVEDDKNRDDVQESVKRWWKHIHPADRPIARKHLLSVLSKSTATLAAISGGLNELQDLKFILRFAARITPPSHHAYAKSGEDEGFGLETHYFAICKKPG